MPFKSPYADVEIPEKDLWSFLLQQPKPQCPDSQAILADPDTGNVYNFGTIRTLSPHISAALKSTFRLPKGSHIGFFTPNDIDTGLLSMAVLHAGYVACPANPMYTVGELEHQIRNAEIKLLFTIPALLKTAAEAAAKAGVSKGNIVLMGVKRQAEFKHWRDIVQDAGDVKVTPPAKIDAKKDLAFIVYSSGTTGLPKGVRLTHYNIVSNICQLQVIDWRYFDSGKDKTIAVLPFFHIYGLVTCLLGFLYSGNEVIVLPRFDLTKICSLIEKHRVTVLFVPPPVILALAKDPIVTKYDLGSLRWITSGAAPLTRELAEGVWKRLKVGTKQGYGLSETSSVASLLQPEYWGKFMGSVGPLVSNMEAMIVDEKMKEVEDGVPGELLLKGPNVFDGYWKLEKLNLELFYKGFFKTGDIAYRDKHGMIYITDRAKELIKYKGYQVAPAELEGLLLARPEINDVCVIGIMDNTQATEVPRAYIVLRPDVKPSDALAKEISDWVATKVAPYKKLRGGIRWSKEIPKSSAGKILRRKVREEVKREEKEKGAKL